MSMTRTMPWWRRFLGLFGWTPPERPKPEVEAIEQGDRNWQELIVEALDTTGAAIYLGEVRVWAVKSATDPMLVHYVIAIPGQRAICVPCKGFRYSGKCRHLLEVGLDIGG